jgi:hypothetical protein
MNFDTSEESANQEIMKAGKEDDRQLPGHHAFCPNMVDMPLKLLA